MRNIAGRMSARTPAFMSVDTAREGNSDCANGVRGTVRERSISALASAFPKRPRRENTAIRIAIRMENISAGSIAGEYESTQNQIMQIMPMTAAGYHVMVYTVRVRKSCQDAMRKVISTAIADIVRSSAGSSIVYV